LIAQLGLPAAHRSSTLAFALTDEQANPVAYAVGNSLVLTGDIIPRSQS